MQCDYDFLFKILMVGDTGVGKSCLLERFTDDTYSDESVSTIGVDFKIREVVCDGKRIKLQIWDTAGQERFRTITASYYRGAHGIIVAYDTTYEPSYNNVAYWLGEIGRCAAKNVATLLVGTKCDLEKRRAISHDKAAAYAANAQMQFIETSAKTSAHVEDAFLRLVDTVRERQRESATFAATLGAAKHASAKSDVKLASAPLDDANTNKNGCAC